MSAVPVTIKGAAITISDWLLSYLKSRDAKTYQSIYDRMYSALDKDTENYYDAFSLLLEHHQVAFKMLTDARSVGTVLLDFIDPTDQKCITKTKKYTEVLREAEEFFIVLLLLAASNDQKKGSDIGASCVHHLLDSLSEDYSEFPEFRLRILMFGYNVLSHDSPLRHSTFVKCIDFAIKANIFSVIIPYIPMINEWALSWGITACERRVLLGFCWKQLIAQEDKHNDMSQNVLTQYLQAATEEGHEILETEETMAAAVTLIQESIKQNELTVYDSILQLEAVNVLRKTKHAKLVQLLEILVRSFPDDLKQFHVENPDVFEDGKIQFSTCLGKCQMLALATYAGDTAANGGTVTLKELACKLSLDEEGTEALLVQAIRQKLVDAKIDQISRVVKVTFAMQREFGHTQWESLYGRLDTWNMKLAKAVEALNQDGSTRLTVA